MNPAIASYLRHLVVTGIMILLAKLKFPIEGAKEFADAISLLIGTTLLWAIVKYVPSLAKQIGLMCLAGMLCLALPSCQASLGPDGRPVIGVDPVAMAQGIQAWQARHGAKNSTVLIIDGQGRVIKPEQSQPAALPGQQ